MEGGKEVLRNVVDHMGVYFFITIWQKLETHFDLPQKKIKYYFVFLQCFYNLLFHLEYVSHILHYFFHSLLFNWNNILLCFDNWFRGYWADNKGPKKLDFLAMEIGHS